MLQISTLSEGFTIDEYLCGIVFVGVLCYIVVLHFIHHDIGGGMG